MSRRVIGVPCWVDKERIGVGIQYMDYLSQFADVKLIMPWQEYDDSIDMLFLTGGPDAAVNYGQVPGYYTSNSCQFRQFFADYRLKNYIGKKSIFGVCLGMQYLNIHFNGSLDQHISHYTNKDSEHELMDMEGKFLTHKVGKKEEPILFNSSHHQGIKLNQLGENLTPLAISYEGYVERFENKELRIAGIQYHCERMHDAYSNNKIKEFLKLK